MSLQQDCDLCGHVGVHEMKLVNEKTKTKKNLEKRLDNNPRLKNFQHEHYARKRLGKKCKPDSKGYAKEMKEHFVFGQNVTEMKPSKIADALFKRDAEKYYNLQFTGMYAPACISPPFFFKRPPFYK